jgi:rhomboid protease GluP
MNAVVPEYKEEMPVYNLEPGQYVAMAQQVVAQLGWALVRVDETSLACHTPVSDFVHGELITITAEKKGATFGCRPVNEYYLDEAQSRVHAGRYKQAMAALAEAQEKANRNLHPMHREKYGALLLSKSYVVTPLLVYANALVYVAMVVAGLDWLNPTAQSLYVWGGNLRGAMMAGEWWRLLTYMFLHAGGLHILMNVFALLYIGMFLEPLMGRFRFASAYVLTGVCAGLLSIVMHGNSVGVGASGAIFGMYGIFLSVLTTSHIERTMRRTMIRSILFFVVYNLMAGLQGNVDNAAHIGGLVSGFAMGFVYYPGMKHKAPLGRQVMTTAVLAVGVLAIGFVISRWLL